MAIQPATHSRKSLVVVIVAVPLLMCLLVAVAASSAVSSGRYQPSYGDTYSTCFQVAACDDNGCAIKFRDMGHNPVGSACWTGKDVTLYCCCGLGRPPSVA